ncbi:MAG: RNA polymerase sigma factor [Myxococcota bacterium]
MRLKGNSDKLEAFRAGDRQVLGEIYREHVEGVEQMLRSGFSFTSGDKAVRFQGFDEPFRLQEAVQEAFIHAFRESARQAYDGQRAYRPYLMQIVRNRLIDKFRSQQVEDRLFVKLGDVKYDEESEAEAMDRLSGAPPKVSPELESLRSQVGDVLARFIDEQDDADQKVIRMYLLGELTQNEMADELGESRNDVRKRIRQLRERLLKTLKSEGIIGKLEVSEVFQAVTLVMALIGDVT